MVKYHDKIFMSQISVFFCLSLSLIPSHSKAFDFSPDLDSIVANIPDSLTFKTTDIASYINFHFSNVESKTKAIYFWIANNMTYDETDNREWIYSDEVDDFIHHAFINRKGKCQAFAELFKDLCGTTGVQAEVISGLAVSFDRTLEKHAWIAFLDSTTWKLIDPTFAAGYELNDEFVRNYDESYFSIEPSDLIKSHYPYDPIWQLLEYPVNFSEFYHKDFESRFQRDSFSFEDSIEGLKHDGNLQALISVKRRIESYSDGFALIEQYVGYLEENIKTLEHQNSVETFNHYVNDYNSGIQTFNYLKNEINQANTNSIRQNDLLVDLKQLFSNLEHTHTQLKSLVAVEEKLVWSIILLKYELRKLISQIEIVIDELEF